MIYIVGVMQHYEENIHKMPLNEILCRLRCQKSWAPTGVRQGSNDFHAGRVDPAGNQCILARLEYLVVEKGGNRSPPTFFGQQSIKILDLLNTASLGHVVFQELN
jgi:hypothetical protein